MLSYTNELSTISMAIASNSLNRQEGYVYSGAIDYTNFNKGTIEYAAIFYNQNISNAPSLYYINNRTTVKPSGYREATTNYEVYIDSETRTNSIIRKTSDGTNDTLINYFKLRSDKE